MALGGLLAARGMEPSVEFHVLAPRQRLQMIGVDAKPIRTARASVVEVAPRGDRSSQSPPDDAMRLVHSTANRRGSVAVPILAALPHPAPGRGIDFVFGPLRSELMAGQVRLGLASDPSTIRTILVRDRRCLAATA